MKYPKRLIEVDLPIKRISAHARREKSIRHGHISTLHIWWARRPLAACRAVLCASLWIDPVDELCPQKFRDEATKLINEFARKATSEKDLSEHCSEDIWTKWNALSKNNLDSKNPAHLNILRFALLDFIADFANWDNSTQKDFLETARALTQSAHEALGGLPGTRPLVVDPFAGGGSIPLEALRVGADAFASDMNPVAVLLNKVVLEYIPKYGQKLADEVRKWGNWIKEEAEKELAEFYPKDDDGSTPIAYLWARTIKCEGPGCGAEVPLMRSLWLAKKSNKSVALHIIPNPKEKRIDFEIIIKDGNKWFKQDNPEIEIKNPNFDGTVKRGSATCPCCGFTTPVSSVRIQLKDRKGGANDARMFNVVYTKENTQGRFYRLPNQIDFNAVKKAETELKKRIVAYKGNFSLVPNEELIGKASEINKYGINEFGELFSNRQLLGITTLISKISIAFKKLSNEEIGFKIALLTCLSFLNDRQVDASCSLCRWHITGEKHTGTFGRQALGMVWNFSEVNIFTDFSGGYTGAIEWVAKVIENNTKANLKQANIEKASATNQPLPDDSAMILCTDPPYYDAIKYGDLSDFFYVWLKRALSEYYPQLFISEVVDKSSECVVNPFSGKDKLYFEDIMKRSMSDSRRVVAPSGLGIVFFAHKSTSGWESQLQAMIDSGWIITASWPIETEMMARMNAMDNASLASSIQLICRPRENEDGSLKVEIGDWRDVLAELPKRIADWMPRLAGESVVGADAIFACLGPALEIFSRYSKVEKANGDVVTLREYLEQVWAAVAKEALNMIFKDADSTGLEEDARLTAMWLWTLSTGSQKIGDSSQNGEEEEIESDDEDGKGKTKLSGFMLEYDAARKIAQGLGAHLEKLSNLVEVKGDKARLLPVSERMKYLFGKENQIMQSKQKKIILPANLFDALDDVLKHEYKLEIDTGDSGFTAGKTVLDKVHQSMLLFASGRTEALKRMLIEDGIGKDTRFWNLAQSLSALYPASSDEKRWVDGVLVKKKGFGF